MAWRSILATWLLVLAWPSMACGASALASPSTDVKVVDTQLITSQAGDHGVHVTVLGKLQNEVAQPVSDLVVETRLLDAQGRLVDVLTESLYGLVVMPGDAVAFRVQGLGTSPRASYAQVQARVTSGQQTEPRRGGGGQETGWWTTLLVSWGPLAALLGIWLLIMHRYARKSPAVKLIEQQNELVQRQATALERLADALARRAAGADRGG